MHLCEKQARGLRSGGWDLAALHGMPATDELAKALKLASAMKAPVSNAALCSCAAWTRVTAVALHSGCVGVTVICVVFLSESI